MNEKFIHMWVSYKKNGNLLKKLKRDNPYEW